MRLLGEDAELPVSTIPASFENDLERGGIVTCCQYLSVRKKGAMDLKRGEVIKERLKLARRRQATTSESRSCAQMEQTETTGCKYHQSRRIVC
jgi:hypothetical protein